MKRIISTVLSISLALAAGAPALAGGTSYIKVINETKDAGVWVTAYENMPFGLRSIRKAWCVAPGDAPRVQINDIVDTVRVEVKPSGCVGHLYLDKELSTAGGMSSGKGLVHRSFIVRGSDGRYAFLHNGNQ